MTLAATIQQLQQSFSWLAFTEPSLDERLRSIIADTLQAPLHNADQLNYDLHLRKASELLDRCLAHRREWQHVSAEAVRHALDYKLFQDLRASQEVLEAAPWRDAERQAEIAAQVKVAQEFEQAQAPLAAGFAEAARGARSVSDAARKGDRSRQTHVQQRWNIEQNHQELLHQLHRENEGLFNYGQRAERIAVILKQDFQEAYWRVRWATDATSVIFRFEIGEMPKFQTAESPLEDLILWTRNLINEVERELEHEVDCETIVSLRDAMSRSVTGHISGKVCPQIDQAGVNSRHLVLKFGGILDSYKFERDGRVVAVGMSLSFKNMAENHDIRMFGTSAIVHPPSGDGGAASFLDDKAGDKSVFLQDIGIYQPNVSMNWSSEGPVRNIRPHGTWEIFLGEMRSPSAAHQIDWSAVADVNLHLVLRGRQPPLARHVRR